jgi:hypothetical protein
MDEGRLMSAARYLVLRRMRARLVERARQHEARTVHASADSGSTQGVRTASPLGRDDDLGSGAPLSTYFKEARRVTVVPDASEDRAL